jgi:hypothetical protein
MVRQLWIIGVKVALRTIENILLLTLLTSVQVFLFVFPPWGLATKEFYAVF